MKKLILLLFLFPAVAFSQNDFNFTVENGNITWSKVYNSDLTKEDIQKIIKNDAHINSLSDDFTGNSEPVKIDCEENTPIYMRGEILFFASIEFKENRYRVSISNIRIIPTTTISMYGVETTKDPDPLEDYQIRNRGGFRKNTLAYNTRECLDNFFIEKFTFTKSKDDW